MSRNGLTEIDGIWNRELGLDIARAVEFKP